MSEGISEVDIDMDLVEPFNRVGAVIGTLNETERALLFSQGLVCIGQTYKVSLELPEDLRLKVWPLCQEDGTAVDILDLIALGAFAKQNGTLLDLTHEA